MDAKSGPLEAGDSGENGDFGDFGDFCKNRQTAGNNSDKRPRPLETGNFWRKSPEMNAMAKMAKIASLWRFELDAKSGPLEAGNFSENGDFGEIGDFGKNRQRAGDIQNVAKYSNWMPKVALSK